MKIAIGLIGTAFATTIRDQKFEDQITRRIVFLGKIKGLSYAFIVRPPCGAQNHSCH